MESLGPARHRTTLDDRTGSVRIHFDGACQSIGGRRFAAYGYAVDGPEGLVHEECGLAVPPGHPRATNNVAEYVAAIRPLEWLAGRGYRGEVILLGDSQLVVRQMRGDYRVRNDHLREYHARLSQLARTFRSVDYLWVPREENRRADELSKEAIARASRGP